MADEARLVAGVDARRAANGDAAVENCCCSSCSSRCPRMSRSRAAAAARCSARSTRRCCGQANPTWIASATCSGPSLPPASHMAAVTMTDDAVNATAIHRAHSGLSSGGASAHATSSSPCTPAATSVPASDSVSRRSRSGANSATASCRAAISAGDAGAGQPAGKLGFAGARARDGEQLEERAVAEQVKVVRVEMVVVAKTLARFAGARPAVLDSSESSLVEGDRPGGLVTLTDHPFVPAQRGR